jgi:peptide chain release factor
MTKIYLQITSGRGPTECCRAVAKVLELIMHQARQSGLDAEIVESEKGVVHRTLFSAVLLLQGADVETFVSSWEGTVQWIAQSPYRKFHKRKNWFVGVGRLTISEQSNWDESQISFQTLRASGPGGQHVNKTESAVRATHIPSGISVTASDNRSQMQNKRIAIERLMVRLAAIEQQKLLANTQDNWQNHNTLKRGNPVKIIKRELDI